jgi:uncharacterized protein (DUF2336 family)
MVSQALQAHLVGAYDLAPETVAKIVLASREQVTIRLSAGASEDDLNEMVRQMHSAGRLTPSVILRALYTGDIAFFEAAMAARGDVPIANARILIHESSRRGLEALHKKASMPEPLYRLVRAAVDVVDGTGFTGDDRDLASFRSRVITRVLTLTETAEAADADCILDNLWDVLICKSMELA